MSDCPDCAHFRRALLRLQEIADGDDTDGNEPEEILLIVESILIRRAELLAENAKLRGHHGTLRSPENSARPFCEGSAGQRQQGEHQRCLTTYSKRLTATGALTAGFDGR